MYANIFNVDKICFKYMACKMKENGNDIFVTPQKKKVKRFMNNLKLKYAKFDILKMKNGPLLIKNLKRNLDLADQNRDERSPNVSAS